MDIQATVRNLKAMGVRVYVTQLGGTDLTSSAGKMLLAMLSAFADMERDLIVERTQDSRERRRRERNSAARLRPPNENVWQSAQSWRRGSP